MLLALVLIVLGFWHFAASTRAHFKLFFGKGMPDKAIRNRLHGFGYLLLAAGLWAVFQVYDSHMAILVWVGLLQLGALLVSASLTWWPQQVAALWCRIAPGYWWQQAVAFRASAGG